MESTTRDPERKPRGFAGLSSMVSDVDEAIREAGRTSDGARKDSPGAQAAARLRGRSTATSRSGSAPATSGWQPKDGHSPWKILFGVLGVLAVLIMIAEGSSPDSRPTGRPAASPGGAPQPLNVNGGSGSSGGRRPTEERPRVGRGLTLSLAQVRYCLAESIRIDGADPLVNNYSQREVDTFNQLVDDYNSRCSDYRYYRGALSQARREIEPLRSSLLADGRTSFLRRVGRTTAATPDERVRTIQTLLNARGYNAGAADGLIGPATREAIRQFQRDRGLSPDGEPSVYVQYLLEQGRDGR